jgi:hypothetical protein
MSFYSSEYFLLKIRACNTYGGVLCAIFLVGKPKGKIPLGRPGRNLEDDVKWILK